MTLHVHSFGHFHPENAVTNKFLKELDIGTDDQWIQERVGIASRRTVLPLAVSYTHLTLPTIYSV